MAAFDFGYVYFLDAPSVNRIKIGTGICPEDRLNAVRLMSPVPVVLIGMIVGGRTREAELHEKFKERRVHGEWFDADQAMRDEIACLMLGDAWDNACDAARASFLKEIGEAA